jgi:hypothetical protein
MVRFAKILVRLLGTLAGLYGVLIVSGLPSFFQAMSEVGPGIVYATVAVQAVLALYLFWVAYLAWFRFSPQAVRQCCGVLGFIVLATFIVLVGPLIRAAHPFLTLLAIPAALVTVLWGYRRFARYLNRLLFPPVVVEPS